MLGLLGGLLGLCIPAAIVYYFMLGGKEKLAFYLFNQKSLAAKVESLVKKDLSAKFARCTFYAFNDYSNGYSQSEWQEFYNERVSSKQWDKNSKEYAEAVAPFINAIVVREGDFLARRGMENMERSLEYFQPGINDRISLNYFVEPYEYVKDEKRAALSEINNLIRKIEYEKEAPQRAAMARCEKCIHEHRCDWAVKKQTGSCGGYTPKR